MMFNFFERQDNIEIVVPFITGRADFFYRSGFTEDGGDGTPLPYTPAIIRPTELQTIAPFRNDNYVLTFKQNFYKFWKNVKGKRAKITSDNLDIQAQVFVDGSTVYIAINNLDDADQMVDLNFLSGSSPVSRVITSSLVVNGTNTPIYESGTLTNSIPNTIEL